ncbi:hypothetical protein CDL15_Pgr010181 [Punica granatum]|nr:hypothetical protein CDL15_Pgr010181 [Punica granatum]
MVMCRPATNRPLVDTYGGHLNMDLVMMNPRRQKEKIVVILGATGTGKSRLSIDIASRFPAEIVNSDKMQVYKGLDVVTNKITEDEQCGIPHHLLGTVPPDEDFTRADFCYEASLAIGSIGARSQLPVVVGGSNSYVEALVTNHEYYNYHFRSPMYDCCFLWVDVEMPVLHKYVCDRVDRMVQQGLVDEVREMFDPEADYSKGIRRAIGVPELDRYFRTKKFLNRQARARVLKEAIEEIKKNTCKLASRQREKIHRLWNLKGWSLHRLNATKVFHRRGEEADRVWDELVAGPGAAIVTEFLYKNAALVDSGGFTCDPLLGIRFPHAIETTITASTVAR